MGLREQDIFQIHTIAKEYETDEYTAEGLFQIGLIGYLKGIKQNLDEKQITRSIRTELELFLETQSKIKHCSR